MVGHANVGLGIQAKEQTDILRANRVQALAVTFAQSKPWWTTTVFGAEPCHIGLIAISRAPGFDANAHAFFQSVQRASRTVTHQIPRASSSAGVAVPFT